MSKWVSYLNLQSTTKQIISWDTIITSSAFLAFCRLFHFKQEESKSSLPPPPPGHKNKLFKSDWGVGEGFRLFFPNFTLLTKVIKLFCCWLWPKSQKIENFLYKPFSSSFSRFSAVKTLSAWKEKTFTSLLTTYSLHIYIYIYTYVTLVIVTPKQCY